MKSLAKGEDVRIRPVGESAWCKARVVYASPWTNGVMQYIMVKPEGAVAIPVAIYFDTGDIVSFLGERYEIEAAL